MLPAGFGVNAGREPSGYVPNGAPGIGVPIKNTPRRAGGIRRGSLRLGIAVSDPAALLFDGLAAGGQAVPHQLHRAVIRAVCVGQVDIGDTEGGSPVFHRFIERHHFVAEPAA